MAWVASAHFHLMPPISHPLVAILRNTCFAMPGNSPRAAPGCILAWTVHGPSQQTMLVILVASKEHATLKYQQTWRAAQTFTTHASLKQEKKNRAQPRQRQKAVGAVGARPRQSQRLTSQRSRNPPQNQKRQSQRCRNPPQNQKR